MKGSIINPRQTIFAKGRETGRRSLNHIVTETPDPTSLGGVGGVGGLFMHGQEDDYDELEPLRKRWLACRIILSQYFPFGGEGSWEVAGGRNSADFGLFYDGGLLGAEAICKSICLHANI